LSVVVAMTLRVAAPQPSPAGRGGRGAAPAGRSGAGASSSYYETRYFDNVDHAFTCSQFLTDLYRDKVGLLSTPIEPPIEWSSVLASAESRAFVTFVRRRRRRAVPVDPVCAGIITDSLALTPGTRLGPDEILSARGAGGMGDVYRARESSRHPCVHDIERPLA
jgi:hypothetical protein